MREIKMKLPELARENIRDMDTDMLKDVEPGILLDHATDMAEKLRYSGLDKRVSIRREFKK